MRLVLDASVLLSGKIVSSEHMLFTTPSVITEIKPGGRMRRNLEYLIEAGLIIRSPSKEMVNRIRAKAAETGDIKRLSETDIEVLALSKELDALLLTDDYSIQNIAILVNVSYCRVAQEGISKIFIWRYRCRGCGKFWEVFYKHCPICGSQLKTVRKKD